MAWAHLPGTNYWWRIQNLVLLAESLMFSKMSTRYTKALSFTGSETYWQNTSWLVGQLGIGLLAQGFNFSRSLRECTSENMQRKPLVLRARRNICKWVCMHVKWLWDRGFVKERTVLSEKVHVSLAREIKIQMEFCHDCSHVALHVVIRDRSRECVFA